MEDFGEGIIALSGCMNSRFSRFLRENDLPKARETLDTLIRCFGHQNVFVELQYHGIAERICLAPWPVVLRDRWPGRRAEFSSRS
jgi:DNA polymerase-3 subunit alpha